jgi:PAS domain S-box-containing protein
MEIAMSKLKILFVEDVFEDAEIAIRELKKNGFDFNFIRVDTKDEFIDALKNFIPDIIISDYSMPLFDGMKALKISIEHNPLLPFIILTGSINEATAVSCMRAGATDYVIKENIVRLPFAVKDALENFKIRKEKMEAILMLRESETRYRSLTESAIDAIITTNSIGEILSWNNGAEKIFSYTKEEMIGNSITKIIPDRYREQHKKGMKHLMEGGQSYIMGKVIEVLGLQKNGKEIPLELSLSSWETSSGKFFTGIVRDITERKHSEKKILQSLREKETLIRELYHRTKNTMQVIRGMLVLQAKDYQGNFEVQKLVEITNDRIQAISLVHQMLYRSQDLSRISIKEYVEELSDLILQNYDVSPDKIKLDINIGDFNFLLDTAIPLGLILNELLTNSLNYAFPENTNGIIAISLEKKEFNKNVLFFSDNGIGVPDGFDFHDQKSLGLKLIFSIGEQQMMGHVTMENNNGVSCILEFPDNLYETRV